MINQDDIEVGESVIDNTNESLTEINVAEVKIPVKRRPDPLTIAFAVLALAVIVGFGFYFYKYVKNNISLGMTLTEFSTRYHRTDGYFQISVVGLSFPECTVSDLSPAGKTDNSARYFSGEVLSMMNYDIFVSGSINKSNDFIKSMEVSVTIPDGAVVSDLQAETCIIFIPFIQSIYPELITEDAVTFSENLFATQKAVITGDFAVSARVDEAAGYIYLNIVPKENA